MDLVVWVAAAGGVLTGLIVLVITWCVWRMTVAHERIERHFAAIEALLAEMLRSERSSG